MGNRPGPFDHGRGFGLTDFSHFSYKSYLVLLLCLRFLLYLYLFLRLCFLPGLKPLYRLNLLLRLSLLLGHEVFLLHQLFLRMPTVT